MRERTRAECDIIKSSFAKHHGCKRARHCGIMANGRSQANRDFPYIRNMKWCFANSMILIGTATSKN